MTTGDRKKCVVAGAGVMGHSIAQVLAQAGHDVALVDNREEALTRAMELIPSNLETLVEFGRVRPEDIPAVIGRIRPTTDLAGACRGIRFGFETVSEKPEAKNKVFSILDRESPPKAILAGNTSGLDVFAHLDVQHPERVLAVHWFAPPHIIPLVEIAPGPATTPEAVAEAEAFMLELGKVPVVMKRFVPGFIVNRIQNLISAAMLEIWGNDWATPEEIDRAVKLSLGIRLPNVGVAQTYDFTGLDLVHDIMSNNNAVHPKIGEKVAQGHLGAKTSRGVYDYGGRSEKEIMKARDRRYLETLEFMEKKIGFGPV